jgi:hypothetical protein
LTLVGRRRGEWVSGWGREWVDGVGRWREWGEDGWIGVVGGGGGSADTVKHTYGVKIGKMRAKGERKEREGVLKYCFHIV